MTATTAQIRDLIARALHSGVVTVPAIADVIDVPSDVVARHLGALVDANQVEVAKPGHGTIPAQYRVTTLPAPPVLELPVLRARRISVELMALFFSVPPRRETA